MHSGGFNKELSHCAARRRVTLQMAAEVGKSVTSRRSWRLVILVCHSCVTIRECTLISATATTWACCFGLMMSSFSSSSLSAVGPNRTKLVTPNSSLKFTPEELVLYCRDMRVICFLFDRLTPDTQVLEVRVHVVMSSVVVVIPICADDPTRHADAKNLSSDDVHHRQDLPAAQTRVRAVIPERRPGECRWATLSQFLEDDIKACLRPWKLSNREEFGPFWFRIRIRIRIWIIAYFQDNFILHKMLRFLWCCLAPSNLLKMLKNPDLSLRYKKKKIYF